MFASSTSGSQTASPILQTCFHYSDFVQSSSCALPNRVKAGNLILVEISDLPGISINDSLGNSFIMVASKNLPASTYNVQVYYTIAFSSGKDTITVSGAGNYPEIVVHELFRAQVNTHYSTGSGISKSPSVAKYDPGRNVFVLAVMLSHYVPTSVSAGRHYTLVGQYPPAFLADEGGFLSTMTASHFKLGNVQHWAEISLAFA